MTYEKKKIKLLAFAIFLTINLFCQEQQSEWNDFNIRLGYQNVRTLDLNVSPLLYSANNVLVGAEFEKNRTKDYWNIGLDLSVGSNQSKSHGKRVAHVENQSDFFGNADTTTYTLNPLISFIRGELYYAKFWQIAANKLYLGAIATDKFSYGGMGADTWFFNQLSLQPGVVYRHNMDKAVMTFEFSTTIFSYLVRQPYTLDPSLPNPSYLKAYLKTGSSIATLDKFQQADVKLTYDRKLDNAKSIGLQYRFGWMNHKEMENRNLGSYSNSLAIQYTF